MADRHRCLIGIDRGLGFVNREKTLSEPECTGDSDGYPRSCDPYFPERLKAIPRRGTFGCIMKGVDPRNYECPQAHGSQVALRRQPCVPVDANRRANLRPRCTGVRVIANGIPPKTSILGISVAVIMTDKHDLDSSAICRWISREQGMIFTEMRARIEIEYRIGT
jgi:hypothetical protein